MAEKYYSIPDEPEYSAEIRRIENSDPVNADAVVNPVIARLIENTAAVRKLAESKQAELSCMAGQVVGFDAEGAAVEGWNNENLLLNWDFRKPVNRNGKTEYAGVGYTIDRWRLVLGNATINDGSIKFVSMKNADYKRFVEITNMSLKAGQPYTLSLLARVNDVSGVVNLRPCTSDYSGLPSVASKRITSTTDGFELLVKTFVSTADVDKIVVEILCINSENDYIDIDMAAIKLELGPVQTLAHKEGNVWVLKGPPPNKALELTKCQRYQRVYYRTDAPTLPFVGFANSTGHQIVVNLLYDFVAKPANIASDTLVIRKVSTDEVIDNSNIASVTFYGQGRGYYTLVVIFKSAILTPGELYRIGAAQSANLIIDANL